jgi:hypothetical protein
MTNVTELKKGMIVKNQYGEPLTIVEVIGNMIKTKEVRNLYHYTQVRYNGQRLSA